MMETASGDMFALHIDASPAPAINLADPLGEHVVGAVFRPWFDVGGEGGCLQQQGRSVLL